MKNYKYIMLHVLMMPVIASQGYAQSKPVQENDSLMMSYLSKTKFDIDTNAQAVVLFEKGHSALVDGTLRYHIEKAIKVIGTDAIADVSIVNIPKGSYASLSQVKGITYNLENGSIVKEEINKSDILKEKITDGFSIAKFNFRGVKKGSVVYYSYTIERPAFYSIPDWTFQEKYPKLHSEYYVVIPRYITFFPLERTYKMERAKSIGALANCDGCTFIEDGGSGLAGQFWARKNVPAFEREPYMSSSENYQERIKIHISTLYVNQKWININKDWKEITRDYMFNNNQFCGQLKSGNHFLDDKVKELTEHAGTDLEKAKVIFAYLRNNYTATESATGEDEVNDIKEIFKKQEGSGVGINLLLTAMLRKAKLSSDPVVLSTRAKERLNHQFPDPQKIDYVISKVCVDKKDYFLDASVKELSFGVLIPACYNGYCRVVDEKGTFTYLEPDSINDKTLTIVSIVPDMADKNKLSCKLTKLPGALSSLEFRQKWRKDTSEIRKAILKEISGFTAEVELRSFSVDNLLNPDLPLKINYEILTPITINADTKTIYFDPYFDKFFDKNPFTSKKRHFEIEMDYLEDLSYVLNFKLPEGYILDDYPKPMSSKFSENGQITFKNIVAYEPKDNSFSITSRLTRKSNVFPADDYPFLKEFYDNIVEEQHKKIIIKKTF